MWIEIMRRPGPSATGPGAGRDGLEDGCAAHLRVETHPRCPSGELVATMRLATRDPARKDAQGVGDAAGRGSWTGDAPDLLEFSRLLSRDGDTGRLERSASTSRMGDEGPVPDHEPGSRPSRCDAIAFACTDYSSVAEMSRSGPLASPDHSVVNRGRPRPLRGISTSRAGAYRALVSAGAVGGGMIGISRKDSSTIRAIPSARGDARSIRNFSVSSSARSEENDRSMPPPSMA